MVLDLLMMALAPGFVLPEDPPPQWVRAPGPFEPPRALGYQRSARPISAMIAFTSPTSRA